MVSLRHIFTVIFVFCIFPFPCKAQDSACARIPAGSDIKVIDHFNDGKDPNEIDGAPSLECKKPAFLQAAYSNKVRHGEKGYSLELEFYIPKGDQASWSTGLNDIDISAANGISFWMKGAEGSEKLWIALEDSYGASKQTDISPMVKATTDWQEIKVPMDRFPSVDLNKLARLTFLFKGEPNVISGKIYLDDIAFYGGQELFFSGLKDNINRYPGKVTDDERRQVLLTSADREMLMGIAKDTWGFFDNVVDKRSHLPLDWIGMAPERQVGDYTSPTNTGLYFINVVSAFDLGFITREDAVKRISDTLDIIEKMPRWHGLWDNYHSTTNLHVTRRYISSVDNGWLAGGLVIARQAFEKELGRRCSSILKEMDFSALYNKELGQLNLGYDRDTGKYSPYNYGQLNGEARFTSLIAIGKGDVPKEHWYKMARTFPPEVDWQSQKPEGKMVKKDRVEYFQGYYIYEGEKIVPSWGGSLFEFLMPSLMVEEKELAPKGLGLNDLKGARAHIAFADKKGYKAWGFSPCSTPDGNYGGYTEYGVAGIGFKGYKDEGVITPHVVFLSLAFVPEEAISNIRRMLFYFNMYGEYGLYDSVNVKSGKVSYKYLALDQGMILPSIDNYLNNGAIRQRFRKDPIAVKTERLLNENFFE